eukprot:5472819-Prymnesium_polylepis.1
MSFVVTHTLRETQFTREIRLVFCDHIPANSAKTTFTQHNPRLQSTASTKMGFAISSVRLRRFSGVHHDHVFQLKLQSNGKSVFETV